jgi:hypothetical protein
VLSVNMATRIGKQQKNLRLPPSRLSRRAQFQGADDKMIKHFVKAGTTGKSVSAVQGRDARPRLEVETPHETGKSETNLLDSG